MAVPFVFGPAPPMFSGRLSISTSPESSASSSESPRTATTLTFTVAYTGTTPPSPVDDITPKVEELEDDDMLDAKIESPPDNQRNREEEITQTPNGTIARRPRGRPRKHPKTPPTNLGKPPKGRSKTGCITCRRRKKKCDEAKPACQYLFLPIWSYI